MTDPIVVTPRNSNNLKRCNTCGETKSLDAFNRDKGSIDGLHSQCKECRRKYRRANASKIKEYNRAYNLSHLDRKHDANREYRHANADRIREHLRRYQKTPHGRIVFAAARHRRRAKEAEVGGSFTAADIEAIRVAQGNRCYICHKKLKTFHIDHFVPIARGGTNDPGNLRLACPGCNQSKRDKHPHDLGILI